MAGDRSPGRLRPGAFPEAPQKGPNQAVSGGRGGDFGSGLDRVPSRIFAEKSSYLRKTFLVDYRP